MTDDPLLIRYGNSRSGHSLFAPSSAAMWMTCPGSLLANAKGNDTAGYEAAEGTVAHSLAEMWLREGETFARRMIGVTVAKTAGGNRHQILIDNTMFEYVRKYVDWCQETPGDHYQETRVDLSTYMPIPGQGGTADYAACEPGILTITDLKYGKNVRVYAKRNPQAMLYALGFFDLWDWCYGFQRIVIRVCQPRLDIFDVWECSREELLAFAEEVRITARTAWQENAPRVPSYKACKFCRVNSTCPARFQQLADVVDEIFEEELEEPNPEPSLPPGYLGKKDLESPTMPLRIVSAVSTAAGIASAPVVELGTERLARLLFYKKEFTSLFKSVQKELLARAERGETIPYWEVADGKKTREWIDGTPVIARALIGFGNLADDDIVPPTLVSPSVAQKLLVEKSGLKPKEAKTRIDELVKSVAKNRTLKPKRDDKPGVLDLADDMEEEEEEEEDEL